jgi:hypothetical protein
MNIGWVQGFFIAHVGSYESVHLGYIAKYHPPPVDCGSSSGEKSGDEDSSSISKEMELSCGFKIEETSLTC